ncbi:MAG: TauD/TfdA family dioxygenase [Deltaproteobacteria bacterium]|nr:TauD/TfdA family dioxygenase [Deltaproteobacteria bacterium]
MADFEIRPMTTCIGAEIAGIDLREELPDRTIRALEDALHRHLVLFFRKQPITLEQQIAFTRRFGELMVHPFGPSHPDHPEIIVLDQKAPKGEGADEWHADTTFIPEPPLGSVLRAVQLPPLGGDTCFTSMFAAYETLSPPIRQLVDGLRAIHDITGNLVRAAQAGKSSLSLQDALTKWPPVSHPLVRTHPRSGRKALYVYAVAVKRIEGLSEKESDSLLRLLCEHINSPQFQCRFRWEPDSIAFWDNRAVQHLAVPDYPERRVMVRSTLRGDIPR